MFYLTYIKNNKKNLVDNYFGLYGSYCHHILERYALNELLIFELVDYYKKNYKKFIKVKAPYNKYVDLNEKYFNEGLNYFKNFSGFGNNEVLGIEKNYYFNIGGFKFRAIIDLILRKNFDIMIIDHKTKGKMTKKERDEMLNQLYCYSIPILENFGEYPKKLIFNMVRMNEMIVEDFREERVEIVKNWALSMIDEIRAENEWEPHLDYFFCNNICDRRKTCKHLADMIGG